MHGMAQALSFASTLDIARTALVGGCALALIVAGPVLPF